MKTVKSCSVPGLLLVLPLIFDSALAADDKAEISPRLVTLDDYGSVHSPNSPRISPDGRQIVYLFDGQVFAVSTDGGEPRAITSSATQASGIRWSEDGESIFFLTIRDDNTQIYELPMGASGEATQLTHFANGVSSIKLSPDESRVILSISDNDLLEVAEDAEPQPPRCHEAALTCAGGVAAWLAASW